jgi:hypothetical protein
MAWKLGRYFEAHAVAAFTLMDADPSQALCKEILKWIEKSKLNRFTQRDCHRAHRSAKNPLEIDSALRRLEHYGHIRQVEEDRTNKKGRHPSPVWLVNPLGQKGQNGQKS